MTFKKHFFSPMRFFSHAMPETPFQPNVIWPIGKSGLWCFNIVCTKILFPTD